MHSASSPQRPKDVECFKRNSYKLFARQELSFEKCKVIRMSIGGTSNIAVYCHGNLAEQ